MSSATEPTSSPDDSHAGDPGVGDPFIAAAQAVDEAIAATATWPDEQADAARELRRAIEAFHAPVLEKFVSAMRADESAKQILFDLVDDPHVRAVLAMHGIIRDPTASAERPGSEGGATTTIIPIESIKVRNRGADADSPAGSVADVSALDGWTPGPPLTDIDLDDTYRFDATIDGELVFVLFTNVAGKISAFRNACVHQGLTLDGARIIDGLITCPWHGFTFDAISGACTSAPGAQLERFECRVVDDWVWFKQ